MGQALLAARSGSKCNKNTDCRSGFCIDKVCCESACDGGSNGNCQACSNKLTGQADGLCRPIKGGTTCRESKGECDPAEICDGAATTCPLDSKKQGGTACTGDGNPCTLDQCDGTSAPCTHPAGNAGTECRASAGECDPAEACTGTSKTCPADMKSPAGTACGTDGVVCTADQCDGASAACQHSAIENCPPRDGVVPPVLTVTECGTDLGTGACTVAAPEARSGWTRYRGSVLAPNQVFHGGDVVVDPAGVIACVGCSCPPHEGTVDVVCPEGVISPGLINTHDHIGYSNNAPVPHTTRYTDRHQWRADTANLPFNAKTNDEALIAAAELRQMMGGATSMVAETGVAGFLRNLEDVARLESALVKPALAHTFPLADADGVHHPDCQFNAGYDTAATLTGFDAYLPHISEGIDDDAHSEFLCTSVPGANDLITPITAVIHQVATNAADAQVLRQSRSFVSWAPRSNISLYGNTTPVTLLHAAGVPIALGTDWIISGSMNLLRELQCADSYNASSLAGYFSDFELWQMVTTNAAFAAGVERSLGMLKPGYVADISVFDGGVHHDHRAVVAANLADVLLVVRGGKPLYGEDTILTTLAPACTDSLSVCGSTKLGCAATDTGTSFSALASALSPYYALVQCGDPPDEPTCVPSRDGEYPTGGADIDADGLSNATDLCPTVFSPIRPMDGGEQADIDHDGLGDACDPCPNGACAPPSADDLDGDGAPNGTDVCPDVADAAQTDSDGDGKGDACDECAALPNPGFVPCPQPVSVVRNPAVAGHPFTNQPVSLESLYVSAVRPVSVARNGFYAQTASGEDYGGIFVSTGTTVPGVAPGDVVDVLGHYQGDGSLSQIINPQIGTVGSGALVARSVDPADVAEGGALSEQCESVLVSVGPATVTSSNPDAPSDFDEFLVTGNLRVDDELAPALGNDYPVGTSFSSATGVVGFSFGNHKLLPRGASDLAP